MTHLSDSRAPRRRTRPRHQFVCAWCRRTLNGQPRIEDAVENYGMCRRCLEVRLLALGTRYGSPPAGFAARAVGNP